jgi:hypothetical protein
VRYMHWLAASCCLVCFVRRVIPCQASFGALLRMEALCLPQVLQGAGAAQVGGCGGEGCPD